MNAQRTQPAERELANRWINLRNKMGALLSLIPIVAFFALIVLGTIVSAFVRRLGGWNRTYKEVAKRYGGQVYPGYLFSRGQ